MIGDCRTRETVKAAEVEMKLGDEVHKNELLVPAELIDEMVIGIDYLAKA